jgi:anti-sigma regulatory factor (Ser/Thr protein kinase)
MDNKSRREIGEKITAPARIEEVGALVEFVKAHASEAAFEDEKVTAIGLAVEEALHNIIHFACSDGKGDIEISCSVHDSGSLILTIVDTGRAFNMLIAETFPEAADFAEPGKTPSTRAMKKGIKNIEYRRDTTRNILILTVPRLLRER